MTKIDNVLPCLKCGRKLTCVHDEKCEHNVLINRVEYCSACEDRLPPTPEYVAQQQLKQHTDAYNEWRRTQHLPPLGAKYRTVKQRNFSLSDEAYIGIIQLAHELGYLHDETKAPNATQFLEALGQGLLIVRTV